MMGRMVRTALLVSLLFSMLSCEGGSSSPSGANGGSSAPATVSPIRGAAGPIFVAVLENASFSSVIGNPAMPFVNNLAAQNGLATAYFADAHPSLPNYFMMTTGQLVTSSNDFGGTVDADNVV